MNQNTVATISGAQAGRLSILMGNHGVYFEVQGEYTTAFAFTVGRSNIEERLSLLTNILRCLVGCAGDTAIEAIDGKQVRVQMKGNEIEALGWTEKPASIPASVAPFITTDGWFWTNKLAEFFNGDLARAA